MFEYVVIGWILTAMCVAFFQLGVFVQANEKKSEKTGDHAIEFATFNFIAMIIGIIIWFFVF